MHPLLEKDHQQLIDLLDALDKCISTGNSANKVHQYLSDFVALAEEHFRNEDAIMETYKYTESTDHKKEHVIFLEKLYDLKNKFDSGHTPFGKEYMQSLRRWLEAHLYDADDRLEKFLYEINAGSKHIDN